MDFYPLISDFFQRHLEATSLAMDGLAEATGAAVKQAAEAILNERKLFSIGLGADCAGATALGFQGVLAIVVRAARCSAPPARADIL